MVHLTGARAGLSRRSLPGVVLLVVLAVAAVIVISRLPRPINATGTLGVCSYGSPVVTFEKGVWEAAAPDDKRNYPYYEIPVLEWPAGTHYDNDADVLLDAQGNVAYRSGGLVHVTGTVVDMRAGDIPPCFSGFGVRLETIAGP